MSPRKNQRLNSTDAAPSGSTPPATPNHRHQSRRLLRPDANTPPSRHLRSSHPLARQLVIRGRVVTHHPQFGNGIMFVEFEGPAEQLLNRYLDAITT